LRWDRSKQKRGRERERERESNRATRWEQVEEDSAKAVHKEESRTDNKAGTNKQNANGKEDNSKEEMQKECAFGTHKCEWSSQTR